MSDDKWTDEEIDSFGVWMAMGALGLHLSNAAALQRAHDLGYKADGDWYPGCGVSADVLRITCEWCGTVYAGDPRTKQGHRCAASIFRRGDRFFLTGYYGSCVADMELYELNDQLCRTLSGFGGPLDPICDRCITKMINCHEIWLVRQVGPMGEGLPGGEP